MKGQSFQETHFPDGTCFGCGPANATGLRVQSYAGADGTMIARWTPGAHHENGGGGVCGGVLSSLLDCHACAAATLALNEGRDGAWVWCVTKSFSIEFERLAPIEPLELVARVVEQRARSAEIEATASARGNVCTRFRGVFVVPRAAG